MVRSDRVRVWFGAKWLHCGAQEAMDWFKANPSGGGDGGAAEQYSVQDDTSDTSSVAATDSTAGSGLKPRTGTRHVFCCCRPCTAQRPAARRHVSCSAPLIVRICSRGRPLDFAQPALPVFVECCSLARHASVHAGFCEDGMTVWQSANASITTLLSLSRPHPVSEPTSSRAVRKCPFGGFRLPYP